MPKSIKMEADRAGENHAFFAMLLLIIDPTFILQSKIASKADLAEQKLD
jgi:hypothetical protein